MPIRFFDPGYFYRSTGICYVHYRANGEMVADQMIAEIGVESSLCYPCIQGMAGKSRIHFFDASLQGGGVIEIWDDRRGRRIGSWARLLGSTDLRDYPEHVASRRTVMDSNMGMNQSLIRKESELYFIGHWRFCV